MTFRELYDLIADCNMDAVIFIEADHGQKPEQAYFVSVTHDKDLDRGDDINWTPIDNSSGLSTVTAILIR